MSDTNNRSGADAFSDLSLSGMNKYSERNAEAHRVERANELDERIREFASRDRTDEWIMEVPAFCEKEELANKDIFDISREAHRLPLIREEAERLRQMASEAAEREKARLRQEAEQKERDRLAKIDAEAREKVARMEAEAKQKAEEERLRHEAEMERDRREREARIAKEQAEAEEERRRRAAKAVTLREKWE